MTDHEREDRRAFLRKALARLDAEELRRTKEREATRVGQPK
jgi:hypothetical protein